MASFAFSRQHRRSLILKTLLFLIILLCLWLGVPKYQFSLSQYSKSSVSPATVKDSHKALNRLLSIASPELQNKDLLKPIDGTGGERIHDVALRVRTFKKLFEAWEDLHHIPTANGILSGGAIQDLYAGNLASGRSSAELIHSYDAAHNLIVSLSSLLFPWVSPYTDLMSLHAQFYQRHRGIVITAGNSQAAYLQTMIPAIRNLGCTLPIEVLYLGDEDLREAKRAELESLPGVTTRDLSPMINDEGWTPSGWAAKPFALLYSSFRETILIDADSLFVQNPEVLFDDDDYQREGALFFKDRFMIRGSRKEWLEEIIPGPISPKVKETRLWMEESVHMQESGVVVVDKWKHFVALLMVARMNGPDREVVYDKVFGDKETYWLGWELAGDTGYAFHRGAAGILGPIGEDDPENPAEGDTSNESTICGPQLLHLDLDDRPLWFNGWLLPNKFVHDEDQQPVEFEAYIKEPQNTGDAKAWKLHGNNICCLRSDQIFDFRESEREALRMTVDVWRDTLSVH